MQLQPTTAPAADQIAVRLPEVASVSGPMQDELVDIFQHDIPEYFWVARASESYHPPDERGVCGLYLHTKRVYTAYRMLEPTYRALSAIDDYEANCARTAVLLHDGFKYGRQPNDDSDDAHAYADGNLSHLPDYTQPSHDTAMAQFVRTETDLPGEVADCIEAHGGSPEWYGHEGPPPSNDIEMLVHMADVLATSQHHRLPVWHPAPALERAVGDLPTIDNSEWQLLD